jgi:hypothetical protein
MRKSTKMRDACLSLDQYPSTVSFSFDGSKKNFQTRFGSIITILCFGILLIFAAAKAVTLFRLEEVTIVQFSQEGVIDSGTVITDAKLNFGFGIAVFNDADFHMQDYRDYGSLEVFYESWNSTDDWFTPIKTTKCDLTMFEKDYTHEEHLEQEDDSKFY